MFFKKDPDPKIIKRVCYFGTYDRDRPRNRIIIDGLRKKGVEVIECQYSPWGNVEDKSGMGWFDRLRVAVQCGDVPSQRVVALSS